MFDHKQTDKRLVPMRTRHDRQLAVGFAAVIVGTLVTAIVALGALYTTSDQKEQIARAEAEGLQRVTELRLHAERIVAAGRGYLLTGDNVYLQRFKTANDGFAAALALITAPPGSIKNADLVEVRHAWGRYVIAAERATRRGEEGPDDAVAPYFERVMSPARDALEEQLVVLEREQHEELDIELSHVKDTARRSGFVLVLTTFFTLAASLWLSRLTRRRAL
jgi:CHASE3 domain sensor protein